MSAETKAALEAALQAHVESTWPEHMPSSRPVVGAYVCEVAVVDLNESVEGQMSHYFRCTTDNQDYHVTYGLLSTALDDVRGV
jgi:hypothetical protein